MPDPRASEKAVADYEAAVAVIDAAVRDCRYCKGARTRAIKAWHLAPRPDSTDRVGIERRVHAYEEAERTLCGSHREAYRLAYVCSPVSETYWSS